MTKLNIGLVIAATAATVLVLVLVQHQSQVKLREENQSLRRQLEREAQRNADDEGLSGRTAKSRFAPHLPAPSIQAHPTPPEEESTATNRIAQLLNGVKPELTPEQIEAYLKENQRNAASLLAIFRVTGDQALLREAVEKFPNDPRVNFATLFSKDFSPEERQQRLNALKESAPDNAMANYLSALEHFKSGRSDQAVQELSAASGKATFQDYSHDFMQNAEEAWRSAGYSEVESGMIATWDLQLPHLAELKRLNQSIVDLANSYRQAGDEASAQAALQIGIDLGHRMEAGVADPLINQLVGIAIQRQALSAMDPKAAWGTSGQTVQDQLDQLIRQKNTIRDLVKQTAPLQALMSPQDWINYNNRTRTFGEANAIRWLVDKYGQK